MVALFGTEHERSVMRREVNAQHRLVHSDVEDAVAYDAFDPELQLWVAACMFRGVIDTVSFLYGPVDDEAYAALLAALRPLRHDAPGQRVALAERPGELRGVLVGRDAARSAWTTSPARTCAASRRWSSLPAPLARVLGPGHRFLTIGFLPSPFREELGLRWTAKDTASVSTRVTTSRPPSIGVCRGPFANSRGTSSSTTPADRIARGRDVL